MAKKRISQVSYDKRCKCFNGYIDDNENPREWSICEECNGWGYFPECPVCKGDGCESCNSGYVKLEKYVRGDRG